MHPGPQWSWCSLAVPHPKSRRAAILSTAAYARHSASKSTLQHLMQGDRQRLAQLCNGRQAGLWRCGSYAVHATRFYPNTSEFRSVQFACLCFTSALQINIFDVLCFHQKQLLLRVFVGFCGPVKSTPQHQSKPIYRQGCQAEVQAAGFAEHALNGIRFNRSTGSRSLSGRCRPLTELCALHSSCVLSPLQSRTHQGCAALLCFAGAAVQETNSTRSRKLWKLRQLDLNVSSMLLSCSSY